MRSYLVKVLVASTCMLMLGGACKDEEERSPRRTSTDTSSSFSGQITDSDGQASNSNNTSAEPVESQFAATVVGPLVHIWLMPSATMLIDIAIDTSGETLPASFDIGDLGSAPASGSLVDGTDIYESVSGTVRLSSCPRQVGSRLSGSLTNATFANVLNPSETMSVTGEFAVYVLTLDSSSVACVTTTPDPDPDPAPTCAFDLENPCSQTPRGVCCDFIECYSACLDLCLDECGWFDPEDCDEADPEDCDWSYLEDCWMCFDDCEDDCDLSAACEVAIDALEDCEETHCSHIDDDDLLDECILAHCCDEALVALK